MVERDSSIYHRLGVYGACLTGNEKAKQYLNRGGWGG